MTGAPFTLGSSTELSHGHAKLAVVVGGVEQQMFYLPRRKQNFVRSVPGQPFQIKIDLTDTGDVEVLVFDGAASYAEVKQLLATDIPGVIFTGEGRSVVLERMISLVDRPAPLIFGPGTGIIGVKLFNERREPTSTAFSFERGWELGERLIHYGPEIPT